MTDAEALEIALEEIRRLRRWQTEAIIVMDMWERCYDVLAERGYPARPGEFKSVHTCRIIQEWITA